MSKATSSATSAIVATRIGTLNFKKVNESRFVVRCKGKSRIRIVKAASGGWEGTAVPALTNEIGAELVTMGKTPEQCFKRSVASFWN